MIKELDRGRDFRRRSLRRRERCRSTVMFPSRSILKSKALELVSALLSEISRRDLPRRLAIAFDPGILDRLGW